MGNDRELLTPFPSFDPSEDRKHRVIRELPDRDRPFTPLEALMQAAPGEEPELSQLELLGLRDVLADALDELTPRERRLIEARVIEGRSLRSLERELGWRKSHMQRVERRVLAKLAKRLADHPAVRSYLNRHNEKS